jgi:nucleoside-diphosphate-sugar epimerase
LNILLIGGSDNLANRLIASFNKEGHRVSVLTGSYHTGKKYNRVFELYNFPYSSNVLTEIFESVAPDLTVCMGIHDSNYRWEDPMKDSMEFITSFMNILNAFSALGRGRFVLLSSDAVYKDSLPHLITEETEPDANDLKGLSLIEAESLCEKYRSVFGADILTIRLSGNYWQPKTLEDVGDPVSRMCLRVLKDGRVSTVSNRSIMLIHNSDAAFFITKLALTDGRQYSVYNISSGMPIALSDLAGIINEAADKILAGTATGSAGDDRADAADNASGKRREGAAKGAAGTADNASGKRREGEANGAAGTADNASGRRRAGTDAKSGGEAGPEGVVIRSMGKDHGIEALSGTAQALLSTERFEKEFGINRLADLREKAEETLAYMQKHRSIFLADEEKEPGLAERIISYLKELAALSVPYIENLACFIAVFLAAIFLKDSRFFSRIDLFLLYVMLFAVLYGQTQATVSAFLSILSLLIPALRSGSMAAVLMDYGTYVWIAQLFIIGLAIGYLKDKLNEQRDEAKVDHEYMTTQVEDIRDINSTNSRVKDTLETQLINHENSVTKIYEVTSELNQYNSVDILFKATEVICRIMGSRDVSVYILHEGSRYARLFTATSERARQYGKSFIFDEEAGDMHEAFVTRRPYLNKNWDPKYPSLANLVYEGDVNHFIIMVWNLPLEKLNQGQANLLKVICLLTKESVFRAQRYYEMIRNEQHVPDTDVLLREPFRHMVDIYDEAASRRLTDFMVLRVMLLPEGIKATAEVLREHIRPNDYLGLGLRRDAVYVLLSNATPAEGENVIKRLASFGITSVNANHELI